MSRKSASRTMQEGIFSRKGRRWQGTTVPSSTLQSVGVVVAVHDSRSPHHHSVVFAFACFMQIKTDTFCQFDEFACRTNTFFPDSIRMRCIRGRRREGRGSGVATSTNKSPFSTRLPLSLSLFIVSAVRTKHNHSMIFAAHIRASTSYTEG